MEQEDPYVKKDNNKKDYREEHGFTDRVSLCWYCRYFQCGTVTASIEQKHRDELPHTISMIREFLNIIAQSIRRMA
jgi:hypothetical protein